LAIPKSVAVHLDLRSIRSPPSAAGANGTTTLDLLLLLASVFSSAPRVRPSLRWGRIERAELLDSELGTILHILRRYLAPLLVCSVQQPCSTPLKMASVFILH
jgi:hypothetical protein